MDNDNLVTLGVCTKPHGIRGGFSFLLENVEDSVLNNGVEIFLFPKDKHSSVDSGGEKHKIDKISFGNKTIVYLDGINDRNVVEAMLPFVIKFPRDQFPKLDEGVFYISDLVGLAVFDHSTDDKIGVVKRVYDNTAQEILSIKLESGKIIDVVFVEHFVPQIDLDEGKIWINRPREI